MKTPKKMGAPRLDRIRRESRICNKHGRTTFACRGSGRSGSIVWNCMLCENESNARSKAKDPSEKQAYSPPAKIKFGEPCPTCFMTLPLSGVCDKCD